MNKAKLYQHPKYKKLRADVLALDPKAWPEIRDNLIKANPPLIKQGDLDLVAWFVWGTTPQGYEYWQGIARKYQNCPY